MSAVRHLIELARQREAQNLNTYEIYGDITTHLGLKNLLSSLGSNIRDHLKKLDEIESSISPESFSVEKVASVAQPEDGVEYSFDATMEYADFLREIYRREESVVSVYDTLASVAADDEARFYFERLAEDARKHMWLAKDRSDLESLS
jgi:rubrerythrin